MSIIYLHTIFANSPAGETKAAVGLTIAWAATAALGTAVCLVASCGSEANPTDTTAINFAAAGVGTGAAGTVAASAGRSANAGSGGASSAAGSTAVQTAPRGGGGGTSGQKVAAGAGGSAGRAGKGGAQPTAGTSGKPAAETCDQIPPSSSDCAAKLAPGDDRTCTTQVAGQERTYLVLAPKLYNPCKPTPLVVDAHGVTETAREEAGIDSFCSAPPFPTGCYPKGTGSGMRIMANHEGFIVVHPQGLNNAWGASDADFMAQIVTEVKKVANIDTTKVYMTGISNGGMLTYVTGCKYSDIFTAIIPHAGAETYGACTSLKKPMPLMAWVTETDALVNYTQSRAAAVNWASLNKCQNGPHESKRYGGPEADDARICYPGPNVSQENDPAPFTTYEELIPCPKTGKVTICETWDKCDGGVEVMLCRVAPDTENEANNQVGGHVLFVNDTKLFVSAITWPFLKKFW
jgi:poly(3-hydroxybutyrate) depolymerase